MKRPDNLSLRDYSTKDSKWDADRTMADRISKIYHDDEFFRRRGERMCQCSERLLFAQKVAKDTGELKLALRNGNFCHTPFCPVCGRRRSLRWIRRLWEALPKLLDEYPSARWLFLTLTVKNPPVNDTRDALKAMNAAWQRLIQRKALSPVMGWLRATEITYGQVPGHCHPHFHCLLMVPPSWFSGKSYVAHERWVQLWKSCLRADYDPGVDIRVVRYKKDLPEGLTPAEITRLSLESGVIETLKYAVKTAEIVNDPEWFLALARQTYGLRMIATGGAMKGVLKEDKTETDEDLIYADDVKPDSFEEEAFWLAFDWQKQSKRYTRNPGADRKPKE
ncbi:protein rep [Salmonella enterica]|uniref:protein rep n=1 Tax=Salmonella enterica TaxID=28901 RepID=UPI0009AEDA35|nr:protein rep [Salmonella enterica]HAF4757439.1 Replication protein [Salmonella enterica]HCB5214565.1 protein rep [Salmonella enterica subsp. enterica serovar Sandiego]